MSPRSVTAYSVNDFRVFSSRFELFRARLIDAATRVEKCGAAHLYVFNGKSMQDSLDKVSGFCHERTVSLDALECHVPFTAQTLKPRSNARLLARLVRQATQGSWWSAIGNGIRVTVSP